MEASLARDYGQAWGDTPEAHALADRVLEERERQGPGLNGAEFLLTPEAEIDNLWGQDKFSLWAAGEPLMLVGAPGAGKSTLAQQLALRRAGIRSDTLLDYPVKVSDGRVLYIAADRPRQIQRSWRRMVTVEDRPELAKHLVIHRGSPPFYISSEPDRLLEWVRQFPEVDSVFIDAYLDLARLSEESGSAGANDALNQLVIEGIEVVVVHHDRKLGTEQRKLVRLDDIYGGRAVTKGAGSVVWLESEGEFKSRLLHLKAPAWRVPSFEVGIDPVKGRVDRDWRTAP